MDSRFPRCAHAKLIGAQWPSYPLPSGSPPIYPRTTPNRDFQAEELMAYELGYRVQATTTLAVDLALLYHDYDNLRVSVPGSTFTDSSGATIRPLHVENAMTGETYGAELGVQWQTTESWQLHAAYTLLKMNLHRRVGLAASVEAAEGQSAQQQVYVQSDWNLPGHIETGLIGRFVDKLSGFNPGGPGDTIDDYVSLDARLAWDVRTSRSNSWDRTCWTAIIQNLAPAPASRPRQLNPAEACMARSHESFDGRKVARNCVCHETFASAVNLARSRLNSA